MLPWMDALCGVAARGSHSDSTQAHATGPRHARCTQAHARDWACVAQPLHTGPRCVDTGPRTATAHRPTPCRHRPTHSHCTQAHAVSTQAHAQPLHTGPRSLCGVAAPSRERRRGGAPAAETPDAAAWCIDLLGLTVHGPIVHGAVQTLPCIIHCTCVGCGSRLEARRCAWPSCEYAEGLCMARGAWRYARRMPPVVHAR
jgi:hypothetical protein